MKLFCDLLTRRRSNKKKETRKFLSSSSNTLSNNPIESRNHYSNTSYYDQTTNLFDRQSKCTCHYFNINKNCLGKNIHTKQQISNDSISYQPSLNIIPSLEYSSDMKYMLNIFDFCLWYDVRSTLLDMIDRIVTINENHNFIIKKIPSSTTIIKYCLPQSNPIYRKIKRTKTSIAIQTSSEYQQRRNAKIQTNTVTLFPLQKSNNSSSKIFFN